MNLRRLTPAVATHRGMRRRQNEDAIGYEYPNDVKILQSHGALFMVADGVSSLSAGDKASQLAIKQLSKHYYRSDVSQEIEQRFTQAIQQTNRDVLLEFNRTGATTLVAVVIIGDEMLSASVGDSQIFSIIDKTMTQLNEEDINHSGDADDGKLSKAIGYQEELDLSISRHSLESNQKILLCSDGLTRDIDTQQLARLAQMRDPRDAVRRMINTANTAGGTDNISALLINIGDALLAQDLNKHLSSISVRVAVDADPMILQDVPSKPQTQIPLSRPETTVDEELLVPTKLSEIDDIAKENITTSSDNAVSNSRNTTLIIIIVAVVILIIGAVIFGFALASLG